MTLGILLCFQGSNGTGKRTSATPSLRNTRCDFDEHCHSVRLELLRYSYADITLTSSIGYKHCYYVEVTDTLFDIYPTKHIGLMGENKAHVQPSNEILFKIHFKLYSSRGL